MTASAATYFIRSDYVPNQQAVTHDDVSGEAYWTAKRIAASATYQRPVYGYAARLIDRYGLRSVLDVGCGAATKLASLHRRYPQLEITGIDQASAIAYCRATHGFGQWIVDDIAGPVASQAMGTAELVICSDVIEHVEHPDHVLAYVKARMAVGGWCLLSTPEREALRGPSCLLSPNRYHIREWNRQELAAYLTYQGFEIVEHFLQLPVGLGFSRTGWQDMLYQLLKGRALRYNQLCLLRRL